MYRERNGTKQTVHTLDLSQQIQLFRTRIGDRSKLTARPRIVAFLYAGIKIEAEGAIEGITLLGFLHGDPMGSPWGLHELPMNSHELHGNPMMGTMGKSHFSHEHPMSTS